MADQQAEQGAIDTYASCDYYLAQENSLRYLPKQSALSIAPQACLRDALLLMDQHASDHIVVIDEHSQIPLGLVTLSDALHQLAEQRCSVEQAVASIMTAAPFSLPADAPAHRATVLMSKKKLRHVILTEPNGQLCNVVSYSDLFNLRGTGAEALAEQLAATQQIQAISNLCRSVRQRGGELFDCGYGAAAVTQWMSTLNDIIAIRIIELIEDQFDLPPVPWCWLAFGSEGRLEQTFTTDQDNGLIFLPSDAAQTQSLREAFLPFAQAVNQALDRCGFRHCPGNIMAANPDCCLSLSEWQQQFSQWLNVPNPQALLYSSIFFDFRPLYGHYALADSLRQWLLPLPAQHPRFLRALAEEALTCSPALNWFGNLRCDGRAEQRHSIDLKQRGSRPFVDAARIWSLADGVWATNTADRLRAVAANRQLSVEETAGDLEAFALIQRFRIQQQLNAPDSDNTNRIKPAALNTLNRLMLKQAFKQAQKLQLRLRLEYRL